ncbi:hypothetical protein H6P81_021048 [Aristolochia fimbriata]|uniref:Uncharacterized protein n=1 Tax=Aristolochia fimbriata TaxID=158543 RepID=A0AAV7E0E9_ARIFI|nr:hypothetical protein H6P81_021048 [Aristolochia fimbriata]
MDNTGDTGSSVETRPSSVWKTTEETGQGGVCSGPTSSDVETRRSHCFFLARRQTASSRDRRPGPTFRTCRFPSLDFENRRETLCDAVMSAVKAPDQPTATAKSHTRGKAIFEPVSRSCLAPATCHWRPGRIRRRGGRERVRPCGGGVWHVRGGVKGEGVGWRRACVGGPGNWEASVWERVRFT